MTKTFEEELKDREAETFSHWDGCTISKKEFINYADVVNLSQGWVSPEEHQARVNELIEAKEKKIKQLRKINHLYKKSKENAERLAVDRGERLNQAQDELASLESQLQQQALPVVPECVAVAIEKDKQANISISDVFEATFSYENHHLTEAGLWTKNNPEKYIIARNIGFKVEKPQLFYLKHIDMSKHSRYFDFYLEYDGNESMEHKRVDKDEKPGTGYEKSYYTFTQQEIDSMQTGSYEQIEVAE